MAIATHDSIETDRAHSINHPATLVPLGLGQISFTAMGTTIAVFVPLQSLLAGAQAVRGLFSLWEETLSRFRADSDLSILNGRAGQPSPVSALLYEVLSAAISAAERSGGLYDPTLLAQMSRIGYDRSFEAGLATTAEPRDDRPRTGDWRSIRIDRGLRTVELPLESGIDLGGIAKGMAVDAAILRLHQLGIVPALVNAGGDLAITGVPPHSDGWMIDVQSPQRPYRIALREGAMATSGSARRHWQQGSHRRHHIIDPRTGDPAHSDCWSVSVVAATCQAAEIAAKAAFILGSVAGADYLAERGLPGLFQRHDGSCATVGGWPINALHTRIAPTTMPARQGEYRGQTTRSCH